MIGFLPLKNHIISIMYSISTFSRKVYILEKEESLYTCALREYINVAHARENVRNVYIVILHIPFVQKRSWLIRQKQRKQ
jgi:hypothetical protein